MRTDPSSYALLDRIHLDQSLKTIETVFDTRAVLEETFDPERIAAYYLANKPGYTYLHSQQGAVHLAVNPDGQFSRQGFGYQAGRVSEILKTSRARRILELGCCRGYNLIALARRHPDINLTGIDITASYLEEATAAAHQYPGIKVGKGDFHDLEYPDHAFDIVFAVESTCYAIDHPRVLAEVYRVLERGGYYIVFDFFRHRDFHALDPMLKFACTLVERSTAINEGMMINAWVELAKNIGFQIESTEDLTQYIMPNLMKFHALSRNYFRMPGLARTLNHILPGDLVRNNIAGLLMPFTMHLGAQVYQELVLQKV